VKERVIVMSILAVFKKNTPIVVWPKLQETKCEKIRCWCYGSDGN